jgi:hypothetical protein
MKRWVHDHCKGAWAPGQVRCIISGKERGYLNTRGRVFIK